MGSVNLASSDKWARAKVEGAIKEYVIGVWERANIDWVVGEIQFAIEKAFVPVDEVRVMISKAEITATDAGKVRVSELKKRLGWF